MWNETEAYYLKVYPDKVSEIGKNPKQKMALIFKCYFVHSTRLAMRGSEDQKVDYQIHCGLAMGAFNHWVKGTELQSWRMRHVSEIGERLMHAAAELLEKRSRAMISDPLPHILSS